MRKKLLNIFIRLIRLFRKEESLMPELSTVPEGRVRIGRLYTHYGRIVSAYTNPQPAAIRYYVDDKPVSELAYNEALLAGRATRMERVNAACDMCDFQHYGLPCRCDFITGTHTGYYRIHQCSRQYADNPVI